MLWDFWIFPPIFSFTDEARLSFSPESLSNLVKRSVRFNRWRWISSPSLLLTLPCNHLTAIFTLANGRWMACIILFLSLASKPSVLSATFHAPKTSRTDALYPESSMRWRYGWRKRVSEGTEGLFWSGLLSSLEISFEVRSWGWMDLWPQGIRRACAKSFIWLSTLLSILLSVYPFNFLPAWPSLYQSSHEQDWAMRRMLYVGTAEINVESGQKCVCHWACSLRTLVVTINIFIYKGTLTVWHFMYLFILYIKIYILTLPRWQMLKIGKLTLHYSWIVKIGTYITDVFSVIWKSKAIQDSLPKKKENI